MNRYSNVARFLCSSYRPVLCIGGFLLAAFASSYAHAFEGELVVTPPDKFKGSCPASLEFKFAFVGEGYQDAKFRVEKSDGSKTLYLRLARRNPRETPTGVETSFSWGVRKSGEYSVILREKESQEASEEHRPVKVWCTDQDDSYYGWQDYDEDDELGEPAGEIVFGEVEVTEVEPVDGD